MAAMKNPALLENLENFHKALIFHFSYLEAKQEDRTIDDFQQSFMQSTRQYLEFLKIMGAELPTAEKPTPTAATENPDS